MPYYADILQAGVRDLNALMEIEKQYGARLRLQKT